MARRGGEIARTGWRLKQNALQLDNAVRFARFAKCGRRHVVNGDACRSLSIETAVVGVAVKSRLDAGPIDRFSRCSPAETRVHMDHKDIAHWAKQSQKKKTRGEYNRCSRVSMRRVTSALQSVQLRASHSEGTTETATASMLE